MKQCWASPEPMGTTMACVTYTIGIVGGGQLARMMHQASIGLGIRTRLLATSPQESAAQVMNDVVVGSHLDEEAVLAFAKDCDAVTFDHEHVPTELVRRMEATGVAVRPGADAQVHAQDKAVMRQFMERAGFPNPRWQVCDSHEAFVDFAGKIGWPVIAKTSRGGYDGKGVWKVDGPDDVATPFQAMGGLADGHQPIRIIAEELVDFVRERQARDFQEIKTPLLFTKKLWEQSGHWGKYRENMFVIPDEVPNTEDEGPIVSDDAEWMALKPMNCPHHIQVFKHHVHSYRELPIRIAEIGMMHRYEKSGALTGLQRVREMSLNDGHLFVTPEQIQEEFQRALQLIIDVYEDFNLTEYRFRLSLRDPQDTHKYFDNDEMWENAQTMLRAALDEMGVDYFEAEGEAAFYGPKLDIQVKTALGKEETLSTIQLDFLLPERFDLKYIGADGEEHRPVMIHRGVISTMERFTAILIENYKGAFPTWLAPHQVTLIPVSNEKHVDYAWEVAKKLRDRGVRADVDERNEKMQFKIRASQTSKIPYQLIVGDKEMEDGTVNVRRYGQKETQTVSVDDFVQAILADIANKSRVEK